MLDEVNALEKLLDSKFIGLIQRLDGQDRTLARIEDQTTKTNGRVTALERLWEAILERLKGHDRELREIKRAAHGVRAVAPVDTGENRNVRFWMVGAVIATIAGTIAVLGFLGRLK